MHLSKSTLLTLRDAIAVAAVAVLTVQGLRRWYGDRYLVPSDSMQPVLYGDPEHGDVVFVDKLASGAERRRGDLVVVEHPTEVGHQLVKRIAARGDDHDACWIDIVNGDVCLGPDAQHCTREVKDPVALMCSGSGRVVPWASAPGSPSALAALDLQAASGSGPWQLQPIASTIAEARSAFRPRARRARHHDPEHGVLPRGSIGTARPVDCTYLDSTGRRSGSGDDVSVTDCSMHVVFADLAATVLCSIDTSEFVVTFVFEPSVPRVAVWLDGEEVASHAVAAADWRGELTFGHLDGRDFLLLDGQPVVLEPTLAKATVPIPRTYLHVAVVGTAPASVRSLRVDRDVYAYRVHAIGVSGQLRDWPRFVPPGAWFLLGDNAFDSRDSRQFGPVPAKAFLGVPRCVLGPWSRRRWLGS